MKRIAILAALLLAAAPAHAQLNIRKATDKPKQEAVLAAQWNWLYTQEGTWYLVIKTDNRYDDMIWIDLGKDGESATTSIQQLLDMLDSLGDDERFEIDDRYGKAIRVSLYIIAGKRAGYRMVAEGKAGEGYVTTAALKKGVQHIRGKMSLEAAQKAVDK